MKKAIATLLSLTMALSILAQSPAAYAEEIAGFQPVIQEETIELTPGDPQDNQPAVQPETEDGTLSQEEAEEEAPSLTEEEETEEPQEEPEEETPVLTEEEDKEEEPSALALEEQEESQEVTLVNPAQMEVAVTAGLPLYQSVPLTVTLAQEEGGYKQQETLTLPVSGGQAPTAAQALFDQLPAGKYILTVQGSGFAPYTQKIMVENLIYRVELSVGALALDPQTTAHPGVLRMGDLEGDGKIDSTDIGILVDAIQQGENNTVSDLDRSGKVDLVDLQILAASLASPQQVTSTVSARIPAVLTTPKAEENTTVQGELEDLLSGTGAVTLQAASQEAISQENPVTVSFEMAQTETPVQMGGLILESPAETDKEITGMMVQVEDQNGDPYYFYYGTAAPTRTSGAVQSDGSIIIDFDGQIAVKKVTIKITSVNNGGNLAEITKVDFVNNMENRIPAPEMNIPGNLSAQPGSQSFTLTWDKEVNITGYEVKISQGDSSETVRTTANTLTVTTFGGQKLKNGTTYTAQVQSLNGEWRSGYGETVSVTPKADKLPPAPDGLTLTGRFQRIEASWVSMKDTDTYTVYYRKAGEGEFIKIEGVERNSCTIQGLENNTEYEVYVTGTNELGEGPASITSTATTSNVSAVKLPAYNLINTSNGSGQPTAHILSIIHEAGYMKDSPLDSGKTAWGAVDSDYASWYGLDDWDDGAMYPDNGGLQVTFDQKYHIGSISLAQAEDRGHYSYVRVYAHNEEGKEYQIPGVSIVKRSDGSRSYYTIKIPGGVTTDYLRVCVGYGYQERPVSIAEIRFYAYDSLEDDIMALYADDLHVTLQEGVDEETINGLQTRLDTPDSVSGELHPEYDALQRELDNARGLLDETLMNVVNVHTTISSKLDGHQGFTGLNPWQPLGITASAGEEIVVYVGSNNVATGSNAWLQLVATQYNAEHGQVVSKPIQLKVGRNEITVPELTTMDVEHGGALYLQFTGSNTADQYSVRVSGGEQIPVLDLYGITDSQQRLERVTAYLEEMEQAAATLESRHEQLHGESGHAYDPQTCTLNTTDILLDQMMLSVPITQVLAGLGSGSSADKAQRLLDSMDAMDQMMTLFYQHKGLTNLEGAGSSNRLPSQHLNIRYMRMFAGAFMYAAGNHIGIGWDSVTGLSQGSPIVLDQDGRYKSGSFFGWGIAHEIGHNINQSSYAVAEVTNNYFSQISQISEGVRFGYDAIYSKVTSGTLGAASDVFTQLGMYWQLHLAYDKGYEYQIYSDYKTLLDSRFFARVDTYARNTGAAPAPQGVKLTLGGDANQNFIRLASAAAQKDLTEFFTRWGLIPDETTAKYLAQFEPETRAIYYFQDSARDYGFTHDRSTSFEGEAVLTGGTTAAVDDTIPNQVHLTLEANAGDGLLLGYEIARITYEKGQAQTQVVGFTTDGQYTDTVTNINNRGVAYQITAIDNFLNRSQALVLPALKITHDGSYDKSQWTASTNMTSQEDTIPDAGEHDPCGPQPVSAITKVIDNDPGTGYTGTANGDATITLDFHKTLAVTGFKVQGITPAEYEIQVSANGTQWQTLATGTFSEEPVQTIYFPDPEGRPWISTYDASQLRLVLKGVSGSQVSLKELDVLGPTGDNVELLENGIGTLREEFTYAEGESIPAGSLIFTGSYKGNPAYNVVLLYDEEGSIVGGLDEEGSIVASQIILAPDPENGLLGEVSEGYWVYWIEPQALEGMTLPQTVRAELYRVDDATTNQGQRLTSDTLKVALPETLPPITLGGQAD